MNAKRMRRRAQTAIAMVAGLPRRVAGMLKRVLRSPVQLERYDKEQSSDPLSRKAPPPRQNSLLS